MNIVLATFGSLGDLHPTLALARELKRRGHRPLVATFDAYADAVAAAGAGFRAIRPSVEAFGDPHQLLQRLLDPRRGPEFLVRRMFMPHLRASYEDLYAAAEDADLLVSHPITYAAPLVAEKRGLPWASTVLSPLSIMSAVDPPLFPGAAWLHAVHSLGVAPYRMVFSLVKRVVAGWEQPVRELRRELGIPSSRLAQFEGQYSPHLNLALFSPLLAAPRADWPEHTLTCGFARYEGAAPDAAVLSALDAFMSAGDAPLVFGLGSSAVAIAAPFWDAAMDAVSRLGRRAVFLTGQHAAAPATPPGMAAFPYAPYSAVFPRAAAVVHSCGIGTLAQALASGRPQLLVPVAFDQPDNARRAARLGVGRVLPFARATAKRLAAELARILDDTSYAQAAAAAAPRVAAEDGARVAADALERLCAR
ncbi:MAG TPA: nucleotide disphospho-sugar-binding domain-containing protein [Burkholderiales bacterium]|nr:nucleotide disphospho-sugar-binding domain-containing protein [Burkholderiales bacterium]